MNFLRPYPGQRASRVGVAAATIGRKDANVTTHTYIHARALAQTVDMEETDGGRGGDGEGRPTATTGQDGKGEGGTSWRVRG